MSEETETKPAPVETAGMSSGRRFAIGLNVVIQILFTFVIVGLVNYVGFRHFTRWDFTRDQRFVLSPQTKNLLGGLQKPVSAIIYFTPGSPIGQDVQTLLKEYAYTSNGKLTVELVQPYQNFTRAKELSEKYHFGEENIVILDYDGKSKFVNVGEMVEFEQQQQNPFMQQAPKIKAFKGESALTTALLELVEGKPQKLYVVSGHGEPELKIADQLEKPDDAVNLAMNYKRSNIKFENLKLLDVERVPEDATAVMLFGPKQDLSEREIELLDNYWKNKGRLLVLLNGPGKTPRLNAWLAQSGVTPGGGRIMRIATQLNIQTGQRQTVIVGSAEGTFSEAGQAITKEMAGQNAFFFGASTSLELDKTKTQAEQIRFTELAEVGKDFWSELDGMAGPAIPSRDPAREKEGPFTVAVALEKGAMDGVKVDTARMIVVGNSGFLIDGGLQQYEYGLDFALNATNWLLNREGGIGMGIPPKEKKLTSFTLDEKQQTQLALLIVLGLPCVVAAFGFLSWFQRRS
ncbi:MAG: GldG family protein [Chthoniobacteraceae bacterium]